MEIQVKANTPTTFKHTYTPNFTGTLRLGSSCGCTTFPINQFEAKNGIPIDFEFVINKNQNYDGSIKYYALTNLASKQIGSEPVSIKIIP